MIVDNRQILVRLSMFYFIRDAIVGWMFYIGRFSYVVVQLNFWLKNNRQILVWLSMFYSIDDSFVVEMFYISRVPYVVA